MGGIILKNLLKHRQFGQIEELLLSQLEKSSNNKDLLMKLAMIRLQFPFEDYISAINYLNDIIYIDNFNFEAIIIKLYLQNYYLADMDGDFDKIICCDWKNVYKMAVVYYIHSWKFHYIYDSNEDGREKEIEWLKKSIEIYPYLVNPYIKLARLYVKKNCLDKARQCYLNAISCVKSVEFTDEDAINSQAFIDEYITGVRLSSLNFESLKRESQKRT